MNAVLLDGHRQVLAQQPTDNEHLMTRKDELEHFLANVERRALRMAELATRDREEALDIVQEAMYKLVQRYSKRGQAEWGPLFQRILQSKIRDWQRRSRLRNGLRVWFGGGEDKQDNTDVLDTFADNYTPNPATALDNSKAMNQLEHALQALPLRQQQVFLLRVWEGLDVAQTAAAMQCSQGSVKTHYSRAVHKLRNSLADYRL